MNNFFRFKLLDEADEPSLNTSPIPGDDNSSDTTKDDSSDTSTTTDSTTNTDDSEQQGDTTTNDDSDSDADPTSPIPDDSTDGTDGTEDNSDTDNPDDSNSDEDNTPEINPYIKLKYFNKFRDIQDSLEKTLVVLNTLDNTQISFDVKSFINDEINRTIGQIQTLLTDKIEILDSDAISAIYTGLDERIKVIIGLLKTIKNTKEI